MSVLINDLEVEIQEPAEPNTESSQNVERPAAKALSPGDLALILTQQVERLERVRAH